MRRKSLSPGRTAVKPQERVKDLGPRSKLTNLADASPGQAFENNGAPAPSDVPTGTALALPIRENFIVKRCLCVSLLFFAGHIGAGVLKAESVTVRHAEGVVRGFLVLRSVDSGAIIANGDLIQFSRGDRVTSRLVFHFKDGSLQDETAVFTQRERFRLLSNHLVQRGPSFPHPMDVLIDATSGNVTVRHRDDGKDKVIEKRMELPSDLANGMMVTLLKNIAPDAPSTTVSMLFATPKPRLVKLEITPMGRESFSVGRASYKATRFNVKVEIGGLAGLLAPLLGKQPKDTSVWIVGGDAPGFVRSEGQFYEDGPIWRIELASPDYPRASAGP
jgi:hypothetical protein